MVFSYEISVSWFVRVWAVWEPNMIFPYPPISYVTLVMWRHALCALTVNLQLIALNEHKMLRSDRFLYCKSIFISDFVIIPSQCAHWICSLSLHLYQNRTRVSIYFFLVRRFTGMRINSRPKTIFLWMLLYSP